MSDTFSVVTPPVAHPVKPETHTRDPLADASTYINHDDNSSDSPDNNDDDEQTLTPKTGAMDSNGSAGAIPTAEDKSRYETARKELILSLQKKRAVDRQLVSPPFFPTFRVIWHTLSIVLVPSDNCRPALSLFLSYCPPCDALTPATPPHP